MSTFDCVWSAKMPPKSTRNISGKTIAKNTDGLVAQEAAQDRQRQRENGADRVFMRGTPAR